MARDRDKHSSSAESVISIIGPGMTIVGNIETDGTVRIEGSVDGSITAGKAVVIGKNGEVLGDISTQDAVISGRVEGTLRAGSRLELQATCHIEGEVHTRRMQLEEGAVLNGNVHMGENVKMEPAASKSPSSKITASAGSPESGATTARSASASTSDKSDAVAAKDEAGKSGSKSETKSETKSDMKSGSTKADSRETAATGS